VFDVREDGQPILVTRDRKSKIVIAHVIEEKGANEYAVKRLSQDLKLTGYRKIIFKSDNEPAIIALKQGVEEMTSEMEIRFEESPVGESSSNGEIEAVIKSVQGMGRTLKSAIESRINQKLMRDSVLVPWLIRHAASVMSKYIIGNDGMTAYRRLKGKEFKLSIAEFGECVWYLKAKPAGMNKFDSRWDTRSPNSAMLNLNSLPFNLL
jgi:hypothetical protein